MNKIDIKSFLIGVLSLSCFLLIIGANSNLDDLTVKSIKIIDYSNPGQSATILPQGIFVSDSGLDVATFVAADGVGGTDIEFKENYFTISVANGVSSKFGNLSINSDGGLWNSPYKLVEMGISTDDAGLVNVYNKHGHLGAQLHGK